MAIDSEAPPGAQEEHGFLPIPDVKAWRSIYASRGDEPRHRRAADAVLFVVAALGLLVAFLDLIPLAGATIAGIIVAIVAFLHSVPAGIVAVVFVIVYQQLENHFLQPVIYGRTVQLSPLVVLISVLVGAELAGVIGALAAIPVAGSIQVIVRDQLAARRPHPAAEAP